MDSTIGRRHTSDRRFSRKGQASRAPVGARPTLRAIDVTPGPLALEGSALVCPECRTGLDPARLKAGESLPKHARYGHRVSVRGDKPPCRGWIRQLEPDPEGGE